MGAHSSADIVTELMEVILELTGYLMQITKYIRNLGTQYQQFLQTRVHSEMKQLIYLSQ